jgi:CRP/FNR family transcriptional regulator, cyclic AMP receptor protein
MAKRHPLSEKKKILAAKSLVQKIGYLKLELPELPTQTFNAHKIIRPKDELFVIQEGVVEIWHTSHDMLVTELGETSVFGEMPFLGQTMLGCQAIAGSGGVTVGLLSTEKARELDTQTILEDLGPRLAQIQVEHYRTQFQTTDSRLAALLLDLAGEGEIITGLTQEDLADQLGAYRETITNVIQIMKKKKSIQMSRMKITILNKKELRELSEL